MNDAKRALLLKRHGEPACNADPPKHLFKAAGPRCVWCGVNMRGQPKPATTGGTMTTKIFSGPEEPLPDPTPEPEPMPEPEPELEPEPKPDADTAREEKGGRDRAYRRKRRSRKQPDGADDTPEG